MKSWPVLLACAGLAACAVPPDPPPAIPAAPPLRVVAAPPAPILRPPAEAPLAIAEPPDQCGANTAQSLLGRHRSEIPPPLDASRRRVTCTDCPITQDYRQDRLNIFFDEASGIIERVVCG